MPDRVYHVYVLASRTRRLYVGVTGDLCRRIAQHRAGALPGFTRRYGVTRLVHAESHDDVHAAIAREKQLKRWPRWRKERLIEISNPAWDDLGMEWDVRAAAAVPPAGHHRREDDPDTRGPSGTAPAG
jgi:putative endonuclease